MSILNKIRAITPEPAKRIYTGLRDRFKKKYDSEMSFWKLKYNSENHVFKNSHYRKIMLAMAMEEGDEFLKGKIVADFGCGPRGSLVWAESALMRIGIDVLADKYADMFTDSILSHKMVYIKSTEKIIPLPPDFADIVYSLNAMDHVDSFHDMCCEILRILKPGGDFIGSFNLEEPATPSEPQSLNEDKIRASLLDRMQVIHLRISRKGPVNNEYINFFENNLEYNMGEEGILWVRARKYNYQN